MSFVQEFKAFISKGNVIDLAVAVVLGAAFGKIVSAVVEGIIMPLVGEVLPKGGWQSWKVGPVEIGHVLAASVDFVIMAFVVFIVVNKLMKGKKKPDAPAATPDDIILLREIRDLLKSK